MTRFLTSILATFLVTGASLSAAPVKLHDEAPVKITKPAEGVILVDFGRVSFGNLRLTPPAGAKGGITVHFGEAMTNGRINRKPPGTVRYNKTTVQLQGAQTLIAAPPVDKRNTEAKSERHSPAILTPSEWGVVLPFRWVEIEGWPGELTAAHITRQSAFSATWDNDAADFESSDETLNRIWDLCKYSIKATTFCGVYVDGDRERIPYEADAYLNQLSHYATDTDVQLARDTYDHLMKHGTWPTEWAPHMVFMAHADWMRTGDREWLASRYEALKTKLLLDRAGPDGLVVSDARNIKKTDIVDWPKGERDGHVFTKHNTVVNAFHLKAVAMMSEMARAVGNTSDAKEFATRARATHAVFQEKLFDTKAGIYRDGTGTDHSSQHSNLFPLAFGLVAPEHRAKVADWTAKRGMSCSVYAAQYLLEGLFENGADEAALGLILADNDRSWRHMVNSGTTISWEAWDQKYKPNQDWNHAWGAAPANILPRFVLGAEPVVPGWKRARIRPHTGGLKHAKGKVTTPHGPILIDWKQGDTFQLSLTLPGKMPAKLDLPAGKASRLVTVNGKPVKAVRMDGRWILENLVTGTVNVEVK